MHALTAPELAAWLADPARPAPVLLDVRDAWEVAHASIPGVVAIPMGQIPGRVDELEPDRAVVCVCHHGMRSMQVAMFLERRGFTDVWNLSGGIDAWSRQVDPSCPIY
jgi:rhodanese-related sulfurtransferase